MNPESGTRDGAAGRPPWKSWLTVFLLALIFACGMVDRMLLSVVIEPVKRDLQISDSQFGLAQGTAIAIFYVFCAVPFGWAADRFDRRYVLGFGVAIWSLASASCAFTRNFAELFVARAMVGAGEASMGPAGYPMVAGLVPPRHFSLAMIIIVVGIVSGGALGQIIGSALYVWLRAQGGLELDAFGTMAPWRALFLLVSLPGLILAVLLLVVPGERKASRAESAAASNRRPPMPFHRIFAARWRFYVCHGLGIGFQQASLFGVMFWNQAYVQRNFGWATDQVGLVFGSTLLAASIGAIILTGVGAGHWYNRGVTDAHLRWQRIASLLCLPLLAAGYLWGGSPTVVVVCFGLFNLLMGGAIVAGPTSLQLATPPASRGKATAVYVVFASVLGTAVGPGLVGLLTDELFQNERQVGLAIGVCGLAFNVIALIFLSLALPASRAATRATAEDARQQEEELSAGVSATQPEPAPAN